jgi:hypothetical protein
MKKNLIAIIFCLVYSIESNAQNTAYLTGHQWVLEQISVGDTLSYTDPSLLNGLAFTFNSTQCYFTVDGVTDSAPWSFSDGTQTAILLNPGSSQAVFNIDYLDDEMFVYNTDIDVNGTLINYTFQFHPTANP